MQFFNAVIIVGLLALQPSARLSPPPPPPYWFIEHVTLHPFYMPAGVSITIVENTDYKIPAEYILIKNSSVVNLFIVGSPYIPRSNYEDIGVDLPLGIEPLHKVVSGNAYQWQGDDGWSQNGRYEEEIDTLWLHVMRNSIFCDDDKIFDLDPRNQNDKLPKNVQVPESQDVLLPMIYGTKYIYIPLTISYVINEEDYPSTEFDYSSTFDKVIVFIFILLIIALLRNLFFAKKKPAS